MVRDKNLRPRDGKPLSDYPLHERWDEMNEVADEIAEIAATIAAKTSSEPPPIRRTGLPAPREKESGSPSPLPIADAPQPVAPDEINAAIASIKDGKSLEKWLLKQPREAAITIAARAALRVTPFVGEASVGELTGATFRATALARAAGKYPARANELRVVARAADSAVVAAATVAAAHAADSADPFPAFDVARAVGVTRAAAAAAHAAASADPVAAHAAASVAHAAASHPFGALASAAHAAASAHPVAATLATAVLGVAAVPVVAAAVAAHFFNPNEAALWAEVRADAGGVSRDRAAALADRPLWSLGPPDWAANHWAKLQAALPKGQDWDVWIDWYEERLRGESRGESYDLVFATVPQEEWDKGPAAANGWIKAHLPKAVRQRSLVS